MTEERKRLLLTTILAAAPMAVLLFVPLASLGIPFGPTQPLIDFVLDDAFITFRYSANLVDGAGPTWNPGGERVEGYTSFLWMLVVAAGMAVGVDPVTVAKAVSGLSVLGTVVLVARRALPGTWPQSLIPLIGLALCPVYLLASTQGMETGFAALLATVAIDRYLGLHREPKLGSLAIFHVAGTLACLSRPELVVFWGLLTVSLALEYRRSGRGDGLRRLVLSALALVVLPGLIYLAWRWSYYGYPLPNTFYVKRQGGVAGRGGRMLARFLLQVAAPFFGLLLAGLLVRDRPAGRTRRRAVAGALVAISAFLAVALVFRPLQGMLFRFQMPVYPAILLLLAAVRPRLPGDRAGDRASSRLVRVAVVAAFAIYSLATLPEAIRGVSLRWQHDRAAVGRQLAALGPDGPTMLVSESGAIPYFAGWRSSDTIGLNDTRIAHHGLTLDYLRELDPDLVALLVKPTKRLEAYGPVVDLLREGGYDLVAAVAKTGADLELVNDHQHHYFVKSASPWAQQIFEAIVAAPVRKVPPLETLPAASG